MILLFIGSNLLRIIGIAFPHTRIIPIIPYLLIHILKIYPLLRIVTSQIPTLYLTTIWFSRLTILSHLRLQFIDFTVSSSRHFNVFTFVEIHVISRLDIGLSLPTIRCRTEVLSVLTIWKFRSISSIIAKSWVSILAKSRGIAIVPIICLRVCVLLIVFSSIHNII